MGEERGGGSCGITRELQKLKQQAMEYYRENDVPRKLEELLNSTFYLQPADVYGHLVGTWDAHPPPSSPSPPAPRCGNALRLRQEPRMRDGARAGGRGSETLEAARERGNDPWGEGLSTGKVLERRPPEHKGLYTDL
ncbi:hypothetical protein GHT09_008198 [Marmota monax]|uniref:Uncharacterized protein n=1 Tax=Marmota monax TaxID=9995 RepID=A0A834PQS2_MARMO|nr:hypothetical protein GHT09_008198 [Marmota monax]